MTAAIAGRNAQRKSLAPWLKDDVQYYPFQVEDIRRIALMRTETSPGNFLLGSQMGLGKSLQALTVFAIDVVRGKATTLLVVCPVSLRGNWANEIEKFTTFPYIRLGEERDPRRPRVWRQVDAEERRTQIQEFRIGMDGPRVLIANYEQIIAHLDILGRFDMMICDEAHALKNPEAQRTIALHAVRRGRVGLLTGTPILNTVDELWSLLHMIDPKRWPDPQRFKNRYCKFGGFAGRSIVGAKNVNELNRIVAHYMVRRYKRDVLDLAEPYIQKIFVDLHPTQRMLYEQLRDDLKFPDEDGTMQELDNSLEIYLRLSQICGSAGTVPGYEDHSNKLDLLIDEAMDVIRQKDKPIIFTRHRTVHALIMKRLQKAKVGEVFELHGGIPVGHRQFIIDEWTAHKGKLGAPIVCTTQVAGVGLNMTASHDLFFADKGYVPGLHDQAIDRVDRIGQTEPVHVREYITPGTIEKRIERLFELKRGTFNEVVENSVVFAQMLQMIKEDDDE